MCNTSFPDLLEYAHSLQLTTLAVPPQKSSSVQKQFKNCSVHLRPALPVLFAHRIPSSVISTYSVLLSSEAAKGGNRTVNMKHNKIYCVYWGPEPACSSWATPTAHSEGVRMGSVVWSCPIALVLQRGRWQLPWKPASCTVLVEKGLMWKSREYAQQCAEQQKIGSFCSFF